MIGFDFWVQLFVLLACLFYAAPRGGMTLGLMGGIGLIIFIFGFGLKPGKPPVGRYSDHYGCGLRGRYPSGCRRS